jgi:hypothetical protein
MQRWPLAPPAHCCLASRPPIGWPGGQQAPLLQQIEAPGRTLKELARPREQFSVRVEQQTIAALSASPVAPAAGSSRSPCQPARRTSRATRSRSTSRSVCYPARDSDPGNTASTYGRATLGSQRETGRLPTSLRTTRTSLFQNPRRCRYSRPHCWG